MTAKLYFEGGGGGVPSIVGDQSIESMTAKPFGQVHSNITATAAKEISIKSIND